MVTPKVDEPPSTESLAPFVTRTELGVYEFNEPARRFWATTGFETLSRRLVVHSSNRG